MRKQKETEPQVLRIERMFDSFWKIAGYFAVTLSIGFGFGIHIANDACSETTRELTRAHDLEMQQLVNSYQNEQINNLREIIKESERVQPALQKRIGHE